MESKYYLSVDEGEFGPSVIVREKTTGNWLNFCVNGEKEPETGVIINPTCTVIAGQKGDRDIQEELRFSFDKDEPLFKALKAFVLDEACLYSSDNFAEDHNSYMIAAQPSENEIELVLVRDMKNVPMLRNFFKVTFGEKNEIDSGFYFRQFFMLAYFAIEEYNKNLVKKEWPIFVLKP